MSCQPFNPSPDPVLKCQAVYISVDPFQFSGLLHTHTALPPDNRYDRNKHVYSEILPPNYIHILLYPFNIFLELSFHNIDKHTSRHLY